MKHIQCLLLSGMLALAGCGGDKTKFDADSAADISDDRAESLSAERVPGAAEAVAQEYVDALEDGRFEDASAMWAADGVPNGGLPDDLMAAENLEIELRSAGAMEGAAGSLYIEIPIVLTAFDDQDERFERSGSIILRRANNASGATPEQLSWRINSGDFGS